jgi:1-acyl-sn-glycerol-3-phosphate acyltransferase
MARAFFAPDRHSGRLRPDATIVIVRSGEMPELLARQMRTATRLATLLAAALYGLWKHRKLRRDASRAECAEWLHQSCARGLSAINVQLTTSGPLPSRGLVVSNHLSYLDILVLSGAVPCVFVSKAEVKRWPIFGRYARWAGSVFVRRHDRADVARANVGVAESLQNGVPVVLFPEATTTDGERVLRFHSTMLQPAIDDASLVTPCALSYELDDGVVGREVCWWGDMPLLPHFLNLLGKKNIRANIAFGKPLQATGERKQFGECLRLEVLRLYEQSRKNGPTDSPAPSLYSR